MKHTLWLTALWLCGAIAAKAQSTEMTLQPYYDNPTYSFNDAVDITLTQMQLEAPSDTGEGGLFRAFRKWSDFWGNRMSPTAPSGLYKTEPANTAYRYFMTTGHTASLNSQSYNGNWECIGPFNDYYGQKEKQGRIDQLWVHPNDTNIILAGSNGGGLWKTTDAGRNWFCITDGAGFNNTLIPGTLGVTGLAVDPIHHDTIHISSGLLTLNKPDLNSWGYGLGIIYTTDGGTTWREDEEYIDALGGRLKGHATRIKFMPGTHDMFVLHHEADTVSVWFKNTQDPTGEYHKFLSPTTVPYGVKFTDFEFSKVDSTIIVFSATDGSLWVLNALGWGGGLGYWKTIPGMTVSAPFTMSSSGILDVSLSEDDTAFVILDYTNAQRTLWKASIHAPGWQQINANLGSNFSILEVSPDDPDMIYFGRSASLTSDLVRSYDGGVTLHEIPDNIHADVRTIYMYKSSAAAGGLNNVIYAGTDGGVIKKRIADTFFHSITGRGLAVTQFYGFGSSDADDGIIMGGAQDHGYVFYRKKVNPDWEVITPGDGYSTKIGRNGSSRAIGEHNYPSLRSYDLSELNLQTGERVVWHPYQTGSFATNEVNDPSCPDPWNDCSNLVRPLLFSQTNTAYIAYREVYQYVHDSLWNRAFRSDPKDSLDDVVGKKIVDFEIVERDTNWVYLAYRRSAGVNPADPSPTETNLHAKLFYSRNAYSKSPNPLPTWRNITPPVVQDYRIMDVTHDPEHPERIWVALGDVDGTHFDQPSIVGTDTIKRVYYSPDTGKTWHNVSIGLPALPVNKILYLEGADDILFAGTDVGVFKWNKQNNEWELFNENMPPTIVLDMEINYCAGKLRAATFGRGIWETPLYLDTFVTQPGNIISSNTTWASTKYLRSGVRVTNGATFTIQNTGLNETVIYMPRKSNIIVDPGSKLIVNGARITNSCDDCLWDGIRIVGNPNLAQTTPNQGTVEFTNATIEHAKVAVGNYNTTGHPHLSTGGIVKATNTHFLNNGKAVSLEPFSNPTGSPLLKNYKANFVTCTFEVDDDFKGGSENRFLTHVNLRRVIGVEFQGCNFYNRSTAPGYQGEGDGIRTESAGFKMLASCDQVVYPCVYIRNQFTGLRTGVWMGMDNVSMMTSCEIDRANFDSCSIGIRSEGQHWFVATRDSFNMGYGKTTFLNSYECHKNIGIWSANAYHPIIEDNHFEGFTHGGQNINHDNIGTITDNSSSNDNRIYRNSFTNLTRACIARGVNSDGGTYFSDKPTGLRYLCNTFSGNNYDIQIMDFGSPSSNVVHNIAFNQGSRTESAGNQFQDPLSTFHLVGTSSSGYFKYFHTVGVYEPNLPPSPPYNNPQKVPSLSSNTCPSEFSSGGSISTFPLSGTTLNASKDDFFNASTGLVTKVSDYANLVDGGNTTDLLNYVTTSMQIDSPTVRTTLLGHSPYLSYDVLTAAASADILPQSVLIEVLEANPEMLRNEDLLSHLETIPNPLSAPQIESLRLASGNATARSEMIAEIGDYNMEKGRLSTLILNHYLLDTTENDRDSIPVWLDNINNLTSEYSKVAYYAGAGDYTTSASILDDIPTNFTLTSDDNDEWGLYVELWDLLKSIHDDGRTAKEMTGEEIIQLEAIGDNPIATGRLIDNQVDVILNEPLPNFKVPCTIGYESGEMKSGRRSGSTVIRGRGLSGGNGNMIKAYPNPAKDFVVFEYDIKSPSGKLSIRVTNITGQEVAELELQQSIGESRLDTRTLPAGVYLYELHDGSKSIGVGRVVITK